MNNLRNSDKNRVFIRSPNGMVKRLEVFLSLCKLVGGGGCGRIAPLIALNSNSFYDRVVARGNETGKKREEERIARRTQCTVQTIISIFNASTEFIIENCPRN